MIAFGPVPSRRLGRSVGVNNIPPKICTYSCAYCQIGRRGRMQIQREAFYEPEQILADVREKVQAAEDAAEPIDYLAFVPDGEPTLDANIGREIELLRQIGLPIAVISNASLLWRGDVRRELSGADWVSVKVDAGREKTWRHIDHPHRELQYPVLLEGLHQFAAEYSGRLVTETMLAAGINDSPEDARQVTEILAGLSPATAYLSIPTRPPADGRVHAPDAAVINAYYQIVSARIPHVEYLTGYEGNAFAASGDAEADLLSITAVHPMRQDAVQELLARCGVEWDLVEGLLREGKLTQNEYEGNLFYLRAR